MTVKNEEEKEEKRYNHKVLEAKIVPGENLILSPDTEFIENEGEGISKQDYEINAAKRLLERLKKKYAWLLLCIQGNALYATQTVMGICRKNGWEYILTQKDTRQGLLRESYKWIAEGGGKTEIKDIGKEMGREEYINHVEETVGKKQPANIYEYRCTPKDKDGEERRQRFQWVTDIEPTEKSLEEMIQAGRGRWKIENRFNDQKNGMYVIEHLSSRNSTAMKNHYLLTQLADIVMQLYLSWCLLVKKIKEGKRNTSSRLLESFRRQTVTDEDVLYIQRYTTVYLE